MASEISNLQQPANAIVAVTLNCNARCQMCDIWKNDMHGEASPEVFSKLPSSLRDINVSGGEPFLRSDLPEILAAMKQNNPTVRLVISTNGFQPAKFKRLLPEILRIDPKVAIRVSIDGLGATHDTIRGIPKGFEKCKQTLDIAAELGVRDLGVGFTLLEANVHELTAVHDFAEERQIQLSITIATDSAIYFGEDKQGMRPKNSHAVQQAFSHIIEAQYKKWNVKENFRAWFNNTMMQYHESNKRLFPCDAASGFFYMDSFANIYVCHILNKKIGNLGEQTWEELWGSGDADECRSIAAGCDKCWLICTSKSQIYDRKWRIAGEMMRGKMRAFFQGRS